MKAEIKDRWIEKLESGEFPQAVEQLREEDLDGNVTGYCCLGVLCEIAVEDGIIERAGSNNGYVVLDIDGDYSHTENALLPPAVVEWAGLEAAGPSIMTTEFGEVELTTLNDNYKLNFKSIAKLIKEHL